MTLYIIKLITKKLYRIIFKFKKILVTTKYNYYIKNTSRVLFLIAFLNGCTYHDTNRAFIPLKINNKFYPKIIWSHSINNTFEDSYSNLRPVWKNNYIFVANQCGIIKSLDSKDGKEIWSNNLLSSSSIHCSEKLSGGIIESDNKIYVNSELGNIYAINAKNGKLVWKKNSPGEILSSPAIKNKALIIHTSNSILQSLNKINGKINWTIHLDTPHLLSIRGGSTPVISSSCIAIVGGKNGLISAVLINQGKIIWQNYILQNDEKSEIKNVHDIISKPITIGNTVYVISYNGHLEALDIPSGRKIWSRKISSTIDPVSYYNKIYLIDQNDCLFSINAKNGTIIWYQDQLLLHHLNSLIVYDNYIITGDKSGCLYWIDINNGNIIVQQKISNYAIMSLSTADKNKFIVQTRSNEIYAITK